MIIHYDNEALVPAGQFTSDIATEPTTASAGQFTTTQSSTTGLEWWHAFIIALAGITVITAAAIVVIQMVTLLMDALYK